MSEQILCKLCGKYYIGPESIRLHNRKFHSEVEIELEAMFLGLEKKTEEEKAEVIKNTTTQKAKVNAPNTQISRPKKAPKASKDKVSTKTETSKQLKNTTKSPFSTSKILVDIPNVIKTQKSLVTDQKAKPHIGRPKKIIDRKTKVNAPKVNIGTTKTSKNSKTAPKVMKNVVSKKNETPKALTNTQRPMIDTTSPQLFQCAAPLCPEDFDDLKNMTNHMKKCVWLLNPFNCNSCGSIQNKNLKPPVLSLT
jgi:hypothetical protein